MTAPEFNYLLPPEECERLYRVLGRKPTLDPCGHPDQFLEADRVLYGSDASDDGMIVPWGSEDETGYVILNPNHGERAPKDEEDAPNFAWYPLSSWIMQACAEARHANIIALLPAATDRRWFHTSIKGAATSVCLLQQRVKSYAPAPDGGEPVRQGQPKGAHMYVLFTKDRLIFDRFYDELGKDVRDDNGSVTRLARGLVTDPNPIT